MSKKEQFHQTLTHTFHFSLYSVFTIPAASFDFFFFFLSIDTSCCCRDHHLANNLKRRWRDWSCWYFFAFLNKIHSVQLKSSSSLSLSLCLSFCAFLHALSLIVSISWLTQNPFLCVIQSTVLLFFGLNFSHTSFAIFGSTPFSDFWVSLIWSVWIQSGISQTVIGFSLLWLVTEKLTGKPKKITEPLTKLKLPDRV